MVVEMKADSYAWRKNIVTYTKIFLSLYLTYIIVTWSLEALPKRSRFPIFGYKDLVTDENFLSIAIDASFVNESMQKFTDEDWIKLQSMIVPLLPAYFRLGGNASDVTVFEEGKKPGQLTITKKDLLNLKKLINIDGLRLIYSCNALERSGAKWNSSNSVDLLTFAKFQAGFPNFDVQLGNEPNSFQHKFNITVDPTQLGKDFKEFRKILNTIGFSNSKLIGPDVTRPKQFEGDSLSFLADFLNVAIDDINAVSWHQYYVNGHNTSLDEFISPIILDRLGLQIAAVVKTVRQYSAKIPIWLTETASAYGGGAPGLSDRFVSTFMYLDKLGLSASSGISVVMKQSLYQGNYALLNADFSPRPNYWIAFFHKALVGNRVHHVVGMERDDYLRVYSQSVGPRAVCLNNDTLEPYMTVFGLNLHNTEQRLGLCSAPECFLCATYIFTSPNGNLTSTDILMNGRELSWNYSDPLNFEIILHQYASSRHDDVIPPFSLFFYVFAVSNE